MPELPEVETTCQGIAPHITGQTIRQVIIRQPRLRWPMPADLHRLQGKIVQAVRRRAKYLLIDVGGTPGLLVHLGMSGSLRVVPAEAPAAKHDHIDLVLASGLALRFTDPRRFGCWLWNEPADQHKLLTELGPEPLSDAFAADYLYRVSRNRKVALKLFIMSNATVVGVGNIYANEALFMAGLHPKMAAGRLSRPSSERLVTAIKQVLASAIKSGGTTLRDFTQADGKPGYFAQTLQVYGRGGEPCRRCETLLKEIRLGQRSSVYCPSCQKRR